MVSLNVGLLVDGFLVDGLIVFVNLIVFVGLIGLEGVDDFEDAFIVDDLVITFGFLTNELNVEFISLITFFIEEDFR